MEQDSDQVFCRNQYWNTASKWGLQDKYKTTHGAVFEVSEEDADYFITAKDLEDTLSYLSNLIVLDSIVDMDELEHKLYDKLKADIEETFE